MTSPLRYPGGKTRACKVLDEIVITCFGIPTHIYSPFFGGGSFELHMMKKYKCRISAADAFMPLANFWLTIQDGHMPLLLDEVRSLRPMSKERFNDMRRHIMDPDLPPITRAAYYYTINRCSFSGATMSGGFSLDAATNRFNDTALERLASVDLSQVHFKHQDFQQFLEEVDTETHGCLIFLDPPYYVESKLYGKFGDMHEGFDHTRLASMLKSKTRWVLCYNDCDYIRNLYRGYTILNVSWSYGMNRSKQSSEIVILSHPQQP